MNSLKKEISISVFSSSRKFIMAIATAMIVFAHSPQNLDIIFPGNTFFQRAWMTTDSLLYGGVDIFLFVSGLGLYYSLKNNSNVKNFYKKRMQRILPELMCVVVVWNIAFQIFNGGFSIKEFFCDFFLLNFIISGNRLYWYFNLIIFLYLIYPLVHYIYEKYNKIGFYSLLIFIVALTVLAEYFVKSYNTYEIALTRIPCFLIGAWIGKLAKDNVKVHRCSVVIAGVTVIALWVCYYFKIFGEYNELSLRYSTSIFSICLSFILAVIFDAINNNKVRNCLSWLGGYSMEFYLLYEKIVVCSNKVIVLNDPTGIIRTLICIFITAVVSILFKFVIDKSMSKIFQKSKNLI